MGYGLSLRCAVCATPSNEVHGTTASCVNCGSRMTEVTPTPEPCEHCGHPTSCTDYDPDETEMGPEAVSLLSPETHATMAEIRAARERGEPPMLPEEAPKLPGWNWQERARRAEMLAERLAGALVIIRQRNGPKERADAQAALDAWTEHKRQLEEAAEADHQNALFRKEGR